MRTILFSALLGLGVVILVLAAPGLAQSPDEPALVRVDLAEPEDLTRAAALDLPVFAHLSVPGADYLLAVLTSGQQDQLRSLGLPLTVLDPDARGATYYLVESDRPGITQRVTSVFTLLHDDGRQAVGRLRDGVTLEAVEGMDVRAVRLGPDPIVLTPRITGAIPTSPPYDLLVADLIAQVTTDTVREYDGGLSGEWPISVGGQPYVFRTRYTYSGEPIAKATQYVYEHMQALGYDVSYHTYTLSGYALRNVIGGKRGLVHPDQIVLLTAHLDSRAASWPHDPAPGADDNASGSAALMVAADLLSDLNFAYTLRLVFFTGEEQGMYGSRDYARDVAEAGEDVLGVLNLDMIAWDARSGPDIDLHSHAPSVEDDSDVLADLFAAVVDVYGLDLVPQIVENGTTFSDHYRFWEEGYAAILAIEDYYNASERAAEPRDWNVNYHTVNDRLDTLNLEYFREYVRASLATFVHMADPVRVLSGTVTSAGGGVPVSGTVTAIGQRGVFSGPTDVSGTYTVTLPTGLYTVTASAYGYYPQTFTSVTVLTGTGAHLDFALEPIPMYTVSGSVIDAVSGLPLSATLQFDGGQVITASAGFYSATMFSGTYLVGVGAPFHYSVTRTVVVDRDQRQDFALWPTPCVLVVDDDYHNYYDRAYDDQAYYTATLGALYVDYDVWEVPTAFRAANGPSLDTLRLYRGVIWLTGRDWVSTLTPADQDALAGYLEEGGRLFVSGQDIGYHIGGSDFYRDYLHARYLRDRSFYYELTGADFLDGVTVTIAGGDGADNQGAPSDIDVSGDGVGVFRYTGDGDWAATAYADDTYRAVYFAFGFEGINSAADRRTVMERVLRYLGPCPLPEPYEFELRGEGIRFGKPGGSVTHAVTILNTGLRSDAYDLALSTSAWTTTLPFTRTELVLPRGQVNVSVVVTISPDAVKGDYDQFTLTTTSVYSPAHTAPIVLRTAVGYESYLPLVLKGS